MSSMLAHRIRNEVPSFPEDVVKSWLVPMASSAGWPPNLNSRWNTILLERPLSFWQDLVWRKQPVALGSWTLDRKSLQIAQGLIDANVYGVTNAYSLRRQKSVGLDSSGRRRPAWSPTSGGSLDAFAEGLAADDSPVATG